VNRSLSILVVGSVLLSGCAHAFGPPAATVDGRAVTEAAVQNELDLVLADPQYGQRVKGPGGIGRERDLTRQIVTFLVEQQLIGEYSSAHGIRVTAAEVSQTLAQAQTQAGGPVKFRQQLAKSGLTFPEVRMNIERSLLVRKVQAGVTRDRLANSPTLRAEYQQQIDQYTTYTLSHAIFKTKAEADAALARGAPGATFTTIGSGSTPATQLPPAILAVVRKLQPGGLGGPVATTAGEQQGFELIRLDARVVQPFDVVLPQLLTTHVQAEFTAWLGARLKQADIVVNPRFGTFNRSTGAIAPITSTDQLLGGGPAHSSSP
jgi:hypothetical protein